MKGLLLLFVFFLTSCTPKLYHERDCNQLASINIISRDGFAETINNPERLNQYENVDFLQNQPYEKVLRVFGRDSEGNISAYITTYHPNGELRQYLEVFNNSANGAYREWHENGVQKVEATVIGGTADIGKSAEDSWLFDGVSQAWDEEGHLLAQIEYHKGEMHGNATYFHPNGNVWKVIPYTHDKIEGTANIYQENGELLQSSEYRFGNRHGPTQRYWTPDQPSSDESYSHGALLDASYWDKKGKLLSEIKEGKGYRALFSKRGICELQQYVEGYLDGIVKVFGEHGILLRSYHVKQGLKDGEEIEYYTSKSKQTNSQPMLSVNWYEGAIQGLVKTWYPNGILESQREMAANKKNGVSTGWYSDGSLMIIEDYENNTIVKGEYYQKGEKFPRSEIREGRGIATLYDAEGNFLQKVSYFNGTPT